MEACKKEGVSDHAQSIPQLKHLQGTCLTFRVNKDSFSVMFWYVLTAPVASLEGQVWMPLSLLNINDAQPGICFLERVYFPWCHYCRKRCQPFWRETEFMEKLAIRCFNRMALEATMFYVCFCVCTKPSTSKRWHCTQHILQFVRPAQPEVLRNGKW